MDGTKIEPMPIKGSTTVWKEVLADIVDRAEFGHSRYNTELKTFNGRDALVDTYQELIDGAMYVKQRIMENKHTKKELEECVELIESSSYSNQDSISKAKDILLNVIKSM